MRTKLLICVGFLVALAAGTGLGWQLQRYCTRGPVRPKPPEPSDRRVVSMLARELGLNEQQQDQLKKIWSEFDNRGDLEARRRQYRKQRDEEIKALVPASDLAAYDAVLKKYADEMSAMDEEISKGFQNTWARTREILTADQASKYDAILARGPWGRPGSHDPNRGGPGGPAEEGGRHGGEPPATGPTTGPAMPPPGMSPPIPG